MTLKAPWCWDSTESGRPGQVVKLPTIKRGCSLMVEPLPSKQIVWVRFPPAAPNTIREHSVVESLATDWERTNLFYIYEFQHKEHPLMIRMHWDNDLVQILKDGQQVSRLTMAEYYALDTTIYDYALSYL